MNEAYWVEFRVCRVGSVGFVSLSRLCMASIWLELLGLFMWSFDGATQYASLRLGGMEQRTARGFRLNVRGRDACSGRLQAVKHMCIAARVAAIEHGIC